MSRFEKDKQDNDAKEHARLMREIKDKKEEMRDIGKKK